MTSTDVFRLIQPDLLTSEELVSILRERGVGSSLLSQNKESLVSLYNRVALPLPQRKFRLNYRGSLIMKKRRKREIITIDSTPWDKKKSFTIGMAEPGSSSNSDCRDKCADRLKPPPDMINVDKKRIRLNSSGSSTVSTKSLSTSEDLNKVIIKKRKPTEESSNEVTTDVPIDKDVRSDSKSSNNSTKESLEKTTTTPSPKEESNGEKIESSSRRVLLKRNHLLTKMPSEGSSSTSVSSNSSSSSEAEPVKKRKPITWP